MTATRFLWANRKAEIERFEQILAGDGPQRIMLVEAESGMGKSWLLREYERRAVAYLCVPVDLKGRLGLPTVLSLLGDGLGWKVLPNFASRVQAIAEPQQVSVAKNLMFGSAEIRVALQAPDEEARSFRREALTKALFEDMASLERRVVLLFDTLNDADSEVRDWLMGAFLGHVRNSQNIVVVVASQPPLAEHTTWSNCCEHLHLSGIMNAEEWHTGLEIHNPASVLSIEWIRAYCVYLDGHPHWMALALQKAIGQGSHVPAGGTP